MIKSSDNAPMDLLFYYRLDDCVLLYPCRDGMHGYIRV